MMMKSEIRIIDPITARMMLDTSVGNPRFNNKDQVNRSRVERYARDMKAGNWYLTSEGISFNEDGQLVNGHHRLHAVILADVSVPMYVTYGVPRECTIFDRGLSRSEAQVLRYGDKLGEEVTSPTVISAAKMAMALYDKPSSHREMRHLMARYTETEQRNFIKENRDELMTARRICSYGSSKSKYLLNSGCVAAVFAAIKAGEDVGKLERFAKCVCSHYYDGDAETASVVFFRYAEATKRVSAEEAMEKCAVAECAIYDFCRGKARKKAYANAKHVYFDYLAGKSKTLVGV